MKKTVKIKPYPHRNPAIDNSQSRFAAAVIENENAAGELEYTDRLGTKEFETPVHDFHYDPDSEMATFRPLKDAQGNVKKRTEKITPYIPSQPLKDIIRLVQILQRPILLKGEPGSGKTQFARAVAYEWYGDSYRNHYFEWHIKSTSKATDGLYQFDHIGRLRDAHLQHHTNATPQIKEAKDYRSFGPLAKAFLTSTADQPSILIIDEIDKADIDFPNDLLLELDEKRFTIPETGESIHAVYPPIIFITSNDERQLPEAFLRRCLFLYIRFPDDTQLVEIIKAHLPGMLENHGDLVQTAMKRFNELRQTIEKDPADFKRVSTSELLDWLKAYHFDLQQETGVNAADLTKERMQQLEQYSAALLKTIAAVKREGF